MIKNPIYCGYRKKPDLRASLSSTAYQSGHDNDNILHNVDFKVVGPNACRIVDPLHPDIMEVHQARYGRKLWTLGVIYVIRC